MPAQKVAGSMTSAAIAGARQVEQQVAGVVARQARHQRFHQPESEVVDRQRRRRGERHRHLHPAEQALGRRRRVDAAADRQAAEREAEDEGGEHQLEGVRRGAQHQRQHADPHDLVDERGEAGEERDREEQAGLAFKSIGVFLSGRMQRRSSKHPHDCRE